jgi:hypothetical protein
MTLNRHNVLAYVLPCFTVIRYLEENELGEMYCIMDINSERHFVNIDA